MSTQVQYRRGTGAQNNAFTGALGEITVDTTNWTLRVHDGATAGGGGNLATVAYVDAEIGGLSADSISNGTSNVKVVSSGGNVTVAVGGTNRGTFYSSGLSITGGIAANGYIDLNNGTSNVFLPASGGNVHFVIAGNSIIKVTAAGIVNDMGNGVGNIGNSTGYFNTIFAKATSAQYADVAELYAADQKYDVGTVLVFGGEHEVTTSAKSHDTAVAGTVSQQPAYVMNSGLQAAHPVAVALLGRVPCKIMGPISKGDLLVASDQPGIACRLDRSKFQPGCVIGKAVEEHAGADIAVIEVVVGRL